MPSRRCWFFKKLCVELVLGLVTMAPLVMLLRNLGEYGWFYAWIFITAFALAFNVAVVGRRRSDVGRPPARLRNTQSGAPDDAPRV